MKSQPLAIIVMGVAGSGKTTVARALAHHLAYKFLDADDFHTADAKAQMATGIPLTDAQRAPWVDKMARELRRLAQQGESSVLAFSGLRATHRQTLRENGSITRFVFLRLPREEIAARLAQRNDHFMPVELLANQFEVLQMPSHESDVLLIDAGTSHEAVLDRVLAALGEAR